MDEESPPFRDLDAALVADLDAVDAGLMRVAQLQRERGRRGVLLTGETRGALLARCAERHIPTERARELVERLRREELER